jgi:hypothetical protein
MGYVHVFSIVGDELEGIDPKSPGWTDSCQRLGEALLKLTCDVRYYAGAGSNRRTHHALGHTANAVNYCGEVHSSDRRIYLWSGNRLCELSLAQGDEVEFAETAIADEKERRSRV